ncbi:MAG: dihydrodipicolinate synthase family protein [Limisphaerales bacterium]
MNQAVFHGCIPALMTPCNESGAPDYASLVATAAQLIEKGMRAVVYCGSMGDWPLLSHQQRQEGVSQLTQAGIPVIVGTGAQNTVQAVDHARHAVEAGASGLMMIPRLLSRGTSPAAQRHHFSAILEAAPDLPAVIYNSPYYGYETRSDLFFQLLEGHKNLIGFKEFGGASSLSYAAEHITGQGQGLSLLVGVDTQVVHGFLHCGAVGAITGIGNVLPEQVLQLVGLCELAVKGDAVARRYAHELEEALRVLSSFDEGPDLVLYYKYLMLLEGHQSYADHFNPTDRLSPSQQAHARSQWELFRAWWSSWDGADYSRAKA